MTNPSDRAPDFPPRIIEVHVTSGEDLVVIGEEAFADWELDAIYASLISRDSDTHCEGCACEEEAEQQGGDT